MFIINLEKMLENINYLKHKHNKKILMVIKSNGYNTSSVKLYQYFENHVEYFVVNKVAEYKELRDLVNKTKILILESINNKELTKINFNKTIISINCLEDAKNILDIKESVTLHLNIDCDMGRYGIKTLEECKKIINTLKSNPFINIEGIYTHFSGSTKTYQVTVNNFLKYTKLYNFKIIHANASNTLNLDLIGTHIRIGMASFGLNEPYLIPSIKVYTKQLIAYDKMYTKQLGYDGIGKTNKGYMILDYGYYNGIIPKYVIDNNNLKYQVLGRPCMNHLYVENTYNKNNKYYYILKNSNQFYNNLSERISKYMVLTSFKKINKIFYLKGTYDLQTIFKNKTVTINKSRSRRYCFKTNISTLFKY